MLSVSERVNKIIDSPTMQVAAKAIKMKSEGIDIVDLSVGEPDFPTPQFIKEAAIKAINENKTKYTQNAGIIELRKAIQKKLKEENNLSYELNEIIVSNGAKQAIFNAVQSIIYEGDEALILAPYWVSYPDMVLLSHGKPIIINCGEENDFKVTIDDLNKNISNKTKLLILCNPSNPTGTAYSRRELEHIAEAVLRHNFYVISDEIYEKLYYKDEPYTSFASIDPELKKRTITINGMSKAYSMTGWRIGYAAGPFEIISAINKIQSHSTSNPCSISQYAALAALEGDQSVVESMKNEFKKRRDFMHKELSSIKDVTCYKSDGAFYLFPNFSKYFGKSTEVIKVNNSYDLAMYFLYEAKVATVPGSAFGAEGYIRISYANSMENLQKGIERIRKAIERLR